jgi:Domain of unknown function (DUF222)
MTPQQYTDLVRDLSPDALAVSDAARCADLLGRLNGLRSWVEAGTLAVTQRLGAFAVESPGLFPEQIVAEATRVSLNQALQAFKRVAALELLLLFGAALATGAVTVEHVDVLARTIAGLDPATKDRLAGRDAFLTEVASRTTAGEFARTLQLEVRRARVDDGIATLERQKRNTRLKNWLDRETGMWCIRGQFNPETGAIIAKRIHDTAEALFHGATPDTCPTDPIDKQQHLDALALFHLTAGKGTGRTGGVDMSILIDSTTLLHGLHDESVVDCGFGIQLPVDTIRRMACVADISPIIVGADGVHLELGRSVRLANPDQRRILRAMYRGCAIPGCSVAWEHVVIHHLEHYRDLGSTDIANLLPLCSKHHHCAHERRWQLSLDQSRNLTITKPDSTTMTTGPPKALAA